MKSEDLERAAEIIAVAIAGGLNGVAAEIGTRPSVECFTIADAIRELDLGPTYPRLMGNADGCPIMQFKPGGRLFLLDCDSDWAMLPPPPNEP